eukprot:358619-Chlamydomonas_euryale.AAC.12
MRDTNGGAAKADRLESPRGATRQRRSTAPAEHTRGAPLRPPPAMQVASRARVFPRASRRRPRCSQVLCWSVALAAQKQRCTIPRRPRPEQRSARPPISQDIPAGDLAAALVG